MSHSDWRSGEPADGLEVDSQFWIKAVRQFHQARLSDDYAYLFLDGVSLRVRRPAGRKRVHMLVAYGVRRDGTRHLLAFMRSQGESQADWEGLLGDLYRRGLEGKQLGLIVTDGCPGLAAAIPTVYPRVRHQRCWVHKMRNILEHVRKRDYDEVKTGAQAIYLAESGAHAEAAFRRFRARWRRERGPWCAAWNATCQSCCRSSPSPGTCGSKLRTTNVIERCFVEVRRRTRPMVCFVNVESVDRIIYSIFQLLQSGMENPHPQPIYTSSLTSPLAFDSVEYRGYYGYYGSDYHYYYADGNGNGNGNGAQLSAPQDPDEPPKELR